MTRQLRVATLAVLVGGLACSTPAIARPANKVVSYRGARIVVPASWPVYDLGRDPTTCVRFDRHAVYLGTPGSEQRCPAHAVGRTEAILLAPLLAHGARARRQRSCAAEWLDTRGLRRTRGLMATATWRRPPGRDRPCDRSLAGSAPAVQASRSVSPPRAHAADAVTAHAAAVYTGLGFDVCQNAEWLCPRVVELLALRAVGMYLGGANMACSQPNLTASWVSAETAAGWHLIPTYVGLQAPGNSCGCASIAPASAGSEGTAAADDAIAQAQAVGIRAGSPIYFDMEAYGRTKSSTSTVLSVPVGVDHRHSTALATSRASTAAARPGSATSPRPMGQRTSNRTTSGSPTGTDCRAQAIRTCRPRTGPFTSACISTRAATT